MPRLIAPLASALILLAALTGCPERRAPIEDDDDDDASTDDDDASTDDDDASTDDDDASTDDDDDSTDDDDDTTPEPVDLIVNETGDPDVPDGFDDATATVDDGCAATILYPLDDSAMPGSFEPPLIQWNAGGNSMHELTVLGGSTTLLVYTTADSYQPTVGQWAAVTGSGVGEILSISLVSGVWSGGGFSSGPCTASEDVTVDVTDANINGTIVYWAPPATKSVSFDAIEGTTNASVSLPGTLCHGCHTVNLANSMLMTYGPDFPGTTNLVDLTSPSTVLQTWGNGFTELKDYAALDPSGDFVVISGVDIFAGGASMGLYDTASGALLQTLTTADSPTMPNWSPDGTTLVYAGCDGGASALGGEDCDLYTQTWDPANSTFGSEQLLAARPSGTTLYYPTFSPDSEWIAYNRAEQYGSGDDTVTTNANPRAKVMLIAASGGTQHELFAANGEGELTNSWPRWAPVQGDYGWVAWSTTRAYGHQVDGRAQLWVSGIDFAAASAGEDPSSAATWIPGQLISEGNHTPTWLPRYVP